MASQTAFVGIVILLAALTAAYLYARFGGKSTTAGAATGLIGNAFWTAAAISVMMFGGEAGLAVGFALLVAIWFIALGNIDLLSDVDVQGYLSSETQDWGRS